MGKRVKFLEPWGYEKAGAVILNVYQPSSIAQSILLNYSKSLAFLTNPIRNVDSGCQISLGQLYRIKL